MFNFLFKRKPPKVRRIFPVINKLDNESAIALINSLLNEHISVQSLFIVALENTDVFFHGFCFAESKESVYGSTLNGYGDFLANCALKKCGEEIEDTYTERRFFYLFLAAVFKELHNRATKNQSFYDDLAKLWMGLIPGARAIRETIDRTILWSDVETKWFSDVTNEDEGEKHLRTFMVPENLRHHNVFKEWDERDLTLEQKAEIDEAMKIFFRN